MLRCGLADVLESHTGVFSRASTALSDALDKFAVVDPRAAEIVKLRFFAGLTRQQAAEVLGVSISTVDTDWTYAKCWLQLELTRTTTTQPTD